MQQRRQACEAEQQQPEDGRRDAPRARLLPLLQQLAEDGDERRRERRVGDERPHEVRHLEGDREGVDLALDAEVAARDDLADEAEDARQPGRDAEDRRRGREVAAPHDGIGGAHAGDQG